MNIWDGCSKRVTFDTMDGIEQKIDKLTVMMTTKVKTDNLNHKVYQSNRGRGEARCNYKQEKISGQV